MLRRPRDRLGLADGVSFRSGQCADLRADAAKRAHSRHPSTEDADPSVPTQQHV